MMLGVIDDLVLPPFRSHPARRDRVSPMVSNWKPAGSGLDALRERMSIGGRLILLLPVEGSVRDAIDSLVVLGEHANPGKYLMKTIEEAFARL